MKPVLLSLLSALKSTARSRLSLQLEILALRHQLAVYQRSSGRPRLKPADRILWAWLAKRWDGWREALVFVKPATVLAWQRRRFRDHWTRLSKRGKPGRPRIAKDVRDLIRRISTANPGWGSPRILGELRKLGIEITKSTVERYMVFLGGLQLTLRRSTVEMIARDAIREHTRFSGGTPGDPG